MKKQLFGLILAIMFLAMAVSVFGDTLIVGKGGKFKKIQAAIDAAEAGDVIVIKSGSYVQDDSLMISQKSDLEIKGEGTVTVACSEYVPVIYISESEKITIRNLHGVHQVKDPAVGKRQCGPGATIITAEDSTGVSVFNCELNGCGQNGFEAMGCNHIVLDNNYIHDNVDSAVILYFTGEEEEETDVRIANNRMENNFGPLVVSPREGLRQLYFEDTDEIPGVTMEKNRWKNNDRMPRKTVVVNKRKVVFRGQPEGYEGDDGKFIVISGILNANTDFPVGEETVSFQGLTMIQFYENGEVSGGFAVDEDSVELEDGSEEFILPAGGWREYWEGGSLKSAVLDDGTVVEFDEDGNYIDNSDSDYNDGIDAGFDGGEEDGATD